LFLISLPLFLVGSPSFVFVCLQFCLPPFGTDLIGMLLSVAGGINFDFCMKISYGFGFLKV